MTRSVRYQPILHTLYYTLHTEHAYCLSYRSLNNVVITTVIEMVELVEILDGKLGKRSVERVHLVIVKYGDILLVLCISTRLRLVTILSLLVKYLVILHADPCNKSYISREISIEHPSVGLASLAQLLRTILKVSVMILVSSHCSNFQVTPLNPTGFKSRALKIHYYCRSHLELFSRMRMKLMA